jgi:hypothetical protein
MHPSACTLRFHCSVKALAFAARRNPQKRGRIFVRGKYRTKNKKPGIAGLLQSLDFGWLISPAWQSDE